MPNMNDFVPKEVHGVEIGNFVDSLISLLQNPSVNGKQRAKNDCAVMVEELKNLTPKGMEDVYTTVIVGISFVFINGLSRLKNKPLTQAKVLKDFSFISAIERKSLHVPFPENDEYEEPLLSKAESHTLVAKATMGGVVPIVAKDISIVTEMLKRGESNTPVISVKGYLDNLTLDDYKALFVALVELCYKVRLKYINV